MSQAVEKATQKSLRGGQPARQHWGHCPQQCVPAARGFPHAWHVAASRGWSTRLCKQHPMSSLEPPPLPLGLERRRARSPLPQRGLWLVSEVGCSCGTEPLLGRSDSDPGRWCQSWLDWAASGRAHGERGRAGVWRAARAGPGSFCVSGGEALRCGLARNGDGGTAHSATRDGRRLSHRRAEQARHGTAHLLTLHSRTCPKTSGKRVAEGWQAHKFLKSMDSI